MSALASLCLSWEEGATEEVKAQESKTCIQEKGEGPPCDENEGEKR